MPADPQGITWMNLRDTQGTVHYPGRAAWTTACGHHYDGPVARLGVGTTLDQPDCAPCEQVAGDAWPWCICLEQTEGWGDCRSCGKPHWASYQLGERAS